MVLHNHGQFVTGKSEEALAALGTKVRSIVPWNPQMNPAERPWGSVLRPLRIVLAAQNVSEAFWPFAASQWQFISNGLATRSKSTTQKGTSPFFMASGGRLANLSFVFELFCGMQVYVRSKADRNRFGMSKLVTRVDAIHLGIHPKKPALLAYVMFPGNASRASASATAWSKRIFTLNSTSSRVRCSCPIARRSSFPRRSSSE